MKGFAFRRRYLHAHEYAPEIRAVIAIMEQANIPAATHAG